MRLDAAATNPLAHFTSELEGAALRRFMVEWLLGQRAVNINVGAQAQAPGAPPAGA